VLAIGIACEHDREDRCFFGHDLRFAAHRRRRRVIVEQSDCVELLADPQVMLLAAFVRDGVELDGQVIEVAAATWAIAGRISYDGEVIVSEFDGPERARWVLDHLGEAMATGDDAPPTSAE
jgi:hypothetical protein